MAEASAVLNVQGMTCDGCAQTIRRVLGREPGVRGVSVDWKAGTARVSFDPSMTSAEGIARSAVFRSRFNAVLSEQ